MKVTTAIDSHNVLGEGPWWSVQEGVLYWIDIKSPKLQRWNPETDEQTVWELPAQVGCFVKTTSGSGLMAMQHGIFYFDFNTETLTPIVDPEADKPGNRFNDGACDRKGRFWIGSMDDSEQGRYLGALYRMDEDHAILNVKSEVGISNGLGWSPDNTVMYYADSYANCIYAYDYDIETGTATNERILVRVDKGAPDGLTVDSEGYIWNAQWGAWRVVRYAPDGSIDLVLDVPVEQPTSCMFGGSDLRDLYITSASIRLTPEELEQQPEAGNVLVVRTDVPGLPEPLFAG